MLILRIEKFGGIIFNTANGHEIWLKNQLFEKIKTILQTRDNVLIKEDDVSKVFQELEIKKIPNYTIVPQTSDINNQNPFVVLNSPIIADINITEKCNLHCGHCYINSSKNGRHMPLADFEHVLEECRKIGITQIALGGGEPTLHPDFPKILKKIHDANIVPNLTTNGYSMKWRTIYAIARYAGAIALSVENIDADFEKRRGFPFATFEKNILKLKTAGVKIVFQITISESNLKTINSTIAYLKKYQPYGFLFLAYKPQGRGLNFDKTLSEIKQSDIKKNIGRIFTHADKKTKIGFDCCLTPALMDMDIENKKSFQGCTASRTSLAIMPNLDVMPCSFISKTVRFPNLRKNTLQEIWHGEFFDDFRKKIKRKTDQKICSTCSNKNICLGGCPEFTLTNCDLSSKD